MSSGRKSTAEQPLELPPRGPSRSTSGTRARVVDGALVAEQVEAEVIELPLERQRAITEMFESLKATSLYDLLGVSRDADKRTVKRAYYDRTREVHPDRFYGKRLGPYKRMLERIFARMTEAHDILCSPDRREQYDTALRANRASLVEALLEEAAAEMAGAEEAARREEALESDALVVDGTSFDSMPPDSTPFGGRPR